MNENKNNSGFVWGLLIGAAIGSLISTEKGRRIIKELSEHGLESIENLMDIDEIKEAMDNGIEKGKEFLNVEEKEEVIVKKKPRLFRGIKK
jgi:hypothetical protein